MWADGCDVHTGKKANIKPSLIKWHVICVGDLYMFTVLDFIAS